jgi:hypothetical protein
MPQWVMAFQGRSSRGLWDLLTISKLQARHKLSETGETESTENNVVAGTFAESMALNGSKNEAVTHFYSGRELLGDRSSSIKLAGYGPNPSQRGNT